MSYTDFETSHYAGHPLELYRFALGDRLWLFTSADHEVAWGEETYTPLYIKRSGFTKVGDGRKSTMEIQVAAANEVALLFRDGWLTGTLIVTVFRHHADDNEYSVLWKGRVTGCKWSGSTASLISDSAFTLFQRAGLRRSYQTGCSHVLFAAACGLSGDAWKQSFSVTAVADRQITITGLSAFGNGYYLGGMLQAGDELRMITAHAGDTVTLVDSIGGLVVGGEVRLWPGCSRTINACLNKFNNLDNYGGLPFLPRKNPFAGDALV